MNDITIIDNVINRLYQDDLEKTLLGEMSTPWYLLDDITYGKTEQLDANNYGLTHPIVPPLGNISHVYNLVLPLLYECLTRVNFKLNTIMAARSFLQFPKLENIINHPHVDSSIPHLVVLYYVNDSDGDTIIYNEKEHETDDLSNLTIKERVTPKKGRVAIFNGMYYHSSSSPTKDKRCIINFNVTDI